MTYILICKVQVLTEYIYVTHGTFQSMALGEVEGGLHMFCRSTVLYSSDCSYVCHRLGSDDEIDHWPYSGDPGSAPHLAMNASSVVVHCL